MNILKKPAVVIGICIFIVLGTSIFGFLNQDSDRVTDQEQVEALVFDGWGITIHDEIAWTVFADQTSAFNGHAVFYLPISITNLGEQSRRFSGVSHRTYGPDGLRLSDVFRSFRRDVVHADTVEMRPGATVAHYVHVLYNGDGEYVIEFYPNQNGSRELVEFVFQVQKPPNLPSAQDPAPGPTLDLGSVFAVEGENIPFTVGSTLLALGFHHRWEVTLGDTIGWTSINAQRSELDGHIVFYLPVTATNVFQFNDEERLFPGFRTFGPDGSPLDDIGVFFRDSVHGPAIRGQRAVPGETLEGNFYILYAGEGEYIIDFGDFSGVRAFIFEIRR